MVEIYGTLGPSCSGKTTLVEMIRCGMTGMRVNLSHVTLKQAENQIKTLHEAAEVCGTEIKLLIDMQGPELRIDPLPAPIFLPEGQTAELGKDGIPVPAFVLPYLCPGQKILLDDGKLLLEVLDQKNHVVRAKVIRGGELKGRKSIALPGSSIYPPTMTEQDQMNLQHAKEAGVSGVMQPFVRNREDLETVRKALDDAECGSVRLFAKIENREGLNQLQELIPAADEIVIARGDLGNAMNLWELPGIQKKISAACRKAKKPFMVVTQMLASMEHQPIPTRAEVSDIYNAVLDGASSVMVTGETAVGQYPVEVIRYLANTVREAENEGRNTI